MLSVLLKTIVIALASTANAQTYRLSCNNQVAVPSGCFNYGYCTGGGFYASCSGPASDCRNGFDFCSKNCKCIRN
ncbi:secreted protein [Melampsora americana]|nr:secreted protein [Melampsora americana]